MTRRRASRDRAAQLARLSAVADLKAQELERRLASELDRLAGIRTDIDFLGQRRAGILGSLSGGVDAPPEATVSLGAYLHAQADAMRLRQAALYRDLARLEVDVAPLRAEAGRARGRVMALETLVARQDRGR